MDSGKVVRVSNIETLQTRFLLITLFMYMIMPPFLVCAKKIQPCFIKLCVNCEKTLTHIISQNSFDVYVVNIYFYAIQ